VQKKKLLVLTSTFPRWKNDSKPSFVFDLCIRLSKQFDVFVLSPHFPGAKQYENLDDVKVYRFKYFITRYQKLSDMDGILAALTNNKLNYMLIPFFLLGGLYALLKYSGKYKPNLIHAHWIIPQGLFAYVNYKILKIPYIITVHGSDIFKLKRLSYIKKLSLKNAKGITVVSDEINRKILKEIDSKLYTEVIPMGVDTHLFKPDIRNQSILKTYGIKGPLLLFVGRIAPEKGIKYLIEAMPKIIEQYREIKLLIIGDGNQKKELKDLVKKKELKEHIIFIDSLSNKELPKYYATADIFVCPSLREGSPISYVESLACGTPIVVGDLPIGREMTGDDRGEVAKQTDSNDLAHKIMILLRKNICENDLFRYVKLKYDWETITDQFINVLTS